MVGFLPENIQEIINETGLVRLLQDKKIKPQLFIDDLESFRYDLIKKGKEKGIEKDVMSEAIEALKDWSLGKHPREGTIKSVNNEYFERKEAGWKIHLNVRIKNHKFVYEYLRLNCPYTCKYAQHSGQTGKDFTVYVGSWDETERFGRTLEERIGEKLEYPTGDTLIDDLPVTNKVMARFDTPRLFNPQFHQYGYYGVPLLEVDVLNTMGSSDKGIIKIKKAVRRAWLELLRIYGGYFNGTYNQAGNKIADFLNYGEVVVIGGVKRIHIMK